MGSTAARCAPACENSVFSSHKPGNLVFHPIHDLRGHIKPGHPPTCEARRPGAISLNTRLFFVTRFKPFFVRSDTFAKHHSRYLKDAKVVIIFDHWPYMTTISHQPALFHRPSDFEYSLINQYIVSNRVALIQSGTKFGYTIVQPLIFLDGREEGQISEFGNIPRPIPLVELSRRGVLS